MTNNTNFPANNSRPTSNDYQFELSKFTGKDYSSFPKVAFFLSETVLKKRLDGVKLMQLPPAILQSVQKVFFLCNKWIVPPSSYVQISERLAQLFNVVHGKTKKKLESVDKKLQRKKEREKKVAPCAQSFLNTKG